MHCGLQRRRNESLFLQTQKEKALDSKDICHFHYQQWLQLSWAALLSLFPARPVWRETGVGTVIILANGLWRDDSDLGRMMHDFGCADPKQMKDAVFANRVAYVKSDKLVRRSMDEYETDGCVIILN